MRSFRDIVELVGWMVFAFILTSGSFSHPRVETVIHEGEDGTVFLKEFPDTAVRANHPMTLDPKLVQQIHRIHPNW